MLKRRGIRHLTDLTRARLGAAGRIELRLPRGWPETTTSVHWHARSAAGALHSGQADSIAELPDQARGARVHVWTPPSETVLTRAQLPTRSRAKIMQALPYALEEQLVEEPDKLHFAYTFEPDGSLAVAITSRARMTAWLETLQQAGIRPTSLCPAMLAIPLHADSWSVALVDQELWIRTGAASGFAAPATAEAPPALLASALREAESAGRKPARIVLSRPPRGFDVDGWSAALGVPVEMDNTDIWDPRMDSIPLLNLLQSEYAPSGQTNQLLRPLRPAAIMLAILLVGWLTVDTVEWVRLRSTHQSYTAEMNQIFRQSFPDAKTVLDPAAQMQRNIENLQSRGGGPADLLPLLTRVAPSLQKQQGVRLQSLKYSERSLTMDLIFTDTQSLDGLRDDLQAAKLQVEVLAANSHGNQVEGRFRIQAGGTRGKAPAERS